MESFVEEDYRESQHDSALRPEIGKDRPVFVSMECGARGIGRDGGYHLEHNQVGEDPDIDGSKTPGFSSLPGKNWKDQGRKRE